MHSNQFRSTTELALSRSIGKDERVHDCIFVILGRRNISSGAFQTCEKLRSCKNSIPSAEKLFAASADITASNIQISVRSSQNVVF